MGPCNQWRHKPVPAQSFCPGLEPWPAQNAGGLSGRQRALQAFGPILHWLVRGEGLLLDTVHTISLIKLEERAACPGT